MSERFPHLDGKKLLVIGTGAPAVIRLPESVLRLRHEVPGALIRLSLTQQALRFVTPTAVNIVSRGNFFLDTWRDDAYESAPHVEISSWADAVLVHPATLHFLGRLANGLADTPLMLALQCMDVPIVVAPSLPPGGAEGHAYLRHLALLTERPNVAVAPPVLGRSMSTGDLGVGAPAPFDSALELVHDMVKEAR